MSKVDATVVECKDPLVLRCTGEAQSIESENAVNTEGGMSAVHTRSKNCGKFSVDLTPD